MPEVYISRRKHDDVPICNSLILRILPVYTIQTSEKCVRLLSVQHETAGTGFQRELWMHDRVYSCLLFLAVFISFLV
jgi:hypothetical protein